MFDTLSDMKISYKEKATIKNKWLKNNSGKSEAHQFNEKLVAKLIETKKQQSCYERIESLATMEWFTQMK